MAKADKRTKCLNEHCTRQRRYNHLVCARCWELLPRSWRKGIPKACTSFTRKDWEGRIVRFFRLTEFVMPTVPAWPRTGINTFDGKPYYWPEKDGLEPDELARFEIKLIEHLWPELEDDGPEWSGIERCEWLKQQIVERFQEEAADVVRKELRRKP